MKLIVSLVTLTISCQLLALNPSRTYKQLPDKLNMQYTETKVKTNDGEAELNVWEFKSNIKTTELILMVHCGEGNMADYLKRVQQFTGLGYNVVAFDYRGFGESSDFEIDNNMYIYPHFQDDVQSMIDYCSKQYATTIHLYGWGIGAGLSLGIGYHSPQVKKIIADTPFLSMEDLETRFSAWDEPMEVPFAGYDKKYEPIYSLDLEPSKMLEKIHIFIGSNDALFTVEDMKTLQAKRPKLINGEIYVIENPDRQDNFSVNEEAYTAQLKKALRK